MLTTNQAIKRLWHYGHFWSPATPPELHIHDKRDLPNDPQDERVQAATTSYQIFMGPDLQLATQRVYGEGRAVTDGLLGKATRDLLEQPRCGCPDFPDPLAAIGEGSWPMPCQKEGVGISVDYDSCPSACPPARMKRILDRVIRIWRDVGVALYEVDWQHATFQEHIRCWWRPLAGHTIGLAEFNRGSCRDSVFCNLDPSIGDGSDDYIGETLKHETGHNMRFGHVRQGAGTMSPTIRRVPLGPWTRDDASWSLIERYFGGDPLAVTPPPTPAPDLPPGEVAVGGFITLNGRPYRLVPGQPPPEI